MDLESLNKEQLAAVTHEDGPLLIIAGAGTGKTKVITSRILYLIEGEKAEPSEILALTFTEKAAEEMVSRVDTLMTLGHEEIWIKTFHGFCENVLREHAATVGLSADYKILTKAQRWFFVKKHIFDFELDHVRPLGNPGSHIDDLLEHFSRVKEEFIDPESYIAFAEKNLADVMAKISMSEQAVNGEIDSETVLGKEIEDAEKMLEAAKAYKKYQELMLRENFVDFGDLSYFVLKILGEKPEILDSYRTRFKYILVDEFQDTNYAQFELIMLLAGEATTTNVVVVGDDDQSIFRWRGASLSNILQFNKKFPKAKKIVLTENYRSYQNILDASYSFIQFNNPDRLEFKEKIEKKLKGQKGDYKNSDIRLMHFENYRDEVSFVVDEIKKSGDYGGSAILTRTNASALMFAEKLREEGIPYYVRSPKGLLSYGDVKDLVSFIRVVADPADDVAVLRLLKIPFFKISGEKIANAIVEAKKGKTHIVSFVSEFKKFIDGAPSNGIVPLVNYFLAKLSYESEEINSFLKFIEEFVEFSGDDVKEFAEFLKAIETSGIPIVTDSDGDEASGDSVKVLTLHGAKGLEFENVYVVHLVEGKFPSTNRKDYLNIPASLTKEIFPDGDYSIEEERRLFYVALTRAKKNLTLSYSDKYEGARKWKKSSFLEEIMEGGLVVVEDRSSTGAVPVQERETSAKISTAPKNNFLVKNFSYSQIETFDTCPLKYFYRYAVSVPVKTHHSAVFGTVIHETLNEFYQSIGVASFDLLMKIYEKNWISEGYENKEHEMARKKAGTEMLRKYYELNSKDWGNQAFLEKDFSIMVGSVNFTGKIDRIDKLADGTYEVIDYKTGGNAKLTPKNKFQLSIYALASARDLRVEVSKLSCYFLEDNKKISLKKLPEDLGLIENEILDYLEQIKNSDFAPTPNHYCNLCDFRLICPAV